MTHSLSLGSISPLVQWSLTKVILALGFGFNLTVRRLFLLSWLPKRLSPSPRSMWLSIDRPDPRPPWPLSRPASLNDRRCSSLLKGIRPPFWPSFEPIESRFSFSKKLFFLKMCQDCKKFPAGLPTNQMKANIRLVLWPLQGQTIVN